MFLYHWSSCKRFGEILGTKLSLYSLKVFSCLWFKILKRKQKLKMSRLGNRTIASCSRADTQRGKSFQFKNRNLFHLWIIFNPLMFAHGTLPTCTNGIWTRTEAWIDIGLIPIHFYSSKLKKKKNPEEMCVSFKQITPVSYGNTNIYGDRNPLNSKWSMAQSSHQCRLVNQLFGIISANFSTQCIILHMVLMIHF